MTGVGENARALLDGRRVWVDRVRMSCHAGRVVAAIAQEGRGALIYLHQTSKGFSVEKMASAAR